MPEPYMRLYVPQLPKGLKVEVIMPPSSNIRIGELVYSGGTKGSTIIILGVEVDGETCQSISRR